MRTRSSSCGNGLLVGLEAEARAPRGDAQRLDGHHAGQRQVRDGGLELGERDDVFTPRAFGARVLPHGVGVAARGDVRPGIDPAGVGLERGLRRAGPDQAEVGADVRDLDAQHEAHAVKPRGKRGALAGLDQQPQLVLVGQDADVEFDAALDRQQQRLGALARAQFQQHLAGERVEPAQPVFAGEGHHVEVGHVGHRGSREQPALFGAQFPVVGGNALINPGSGHCGRS